MSPIISVIVPVYNTAKYLQRCIKSILEQTFLDFELLLIDDGSTDSSASLCDAFATLDARVKVFHKKNGGVSSARNLGLENVSGKWVTFVDSDDWIDRCYFDKIMSANEIEDADVRVSGFKHIHNKGESIYNYCPWNQDKVKGVRTLFITMGGTCVWGKFFKTELIYRNNIRFPLGIRYCEDFYFCATAYIYSTNIAYIGDCNGYNYFERASSVCQNIDDSHINEAIEMNLRISGLTVNERVFSVYHKYICWRILASIQDWVMQPEKHYQLMAAYPFKRKYVLSCPMFWNFRQKMLVLLVLNHGSAIARVLLAIRRYMNLREKK